jgi:DeoR/GlpR family transcriptional regulator of sugar metabolism
MLTQERKLHIQAVLAHDGRVVAKELGEELGLSEDTIRRDLRELAAAGLLQRVHGGALPSSPAMGDFSARERLTTSSKSRIGRAAARLVQAGQVIFLDGGTTAIQVAKYLPLDLRATVVTHSPSIAVELVGHANIVVEIIGGRLFKHSLVSVGAAAIEAITRVRPDIFFMGVTGVHPDAGLTTGDAEEAAVKRAISRQSGETVVLASEEKIGAASPFLVIPLGDADVLVADGALPAGLLEICESSGLSIINASEG